MTVFRAFVAIDLPEDLHDSLDQVIAHYQETMGEVPVRWVPGKNIHLTLKFLGDVSESNYEMLTRIVAKEAASHPAFVISVGSVGAFPNMRRPRVIWTGVEAPEELYKVQRGLEAETTRLGYPPERRSFSPHLTLGRISRNASARDVRRISDVIKSEEIGYLGTARIDALHLFRSDLRPGGAVYTRMYSAPLRK